MHKTLNNAINYTTPIMQCANSCQHGLRWKCVTIFYLLAMLPGMGRQTGMPVLCTVKIQVL